LREWKNLDSIDPAEESKEEEISQNIPGTSTTGQVYFYNSDEEGEEEEGDNNNDDETWTEFDI
jgi:hypothetical protein